MPLSNTPTYVGTNTGVRQWYTKVKRPFVQCCQCEHTVASSQTQLPDLICGVFLNQGEKWFRKHDIKLETIKLWIQIIMWFSFFPKELLCYLSTWKLENHKTISGGWDYMELSIYTFYIVYSLKFFTCMCYSGN